MSIFIVLLVVGIFFGLALLSPLALTRRLGRSWINLTAGFLDMVFTGKLTLWRVAMAMAQDYPFSGIGPGAFIVELPNYFLKQKLAPVPSDSAENAFFQIIAEMGFLGAIFVLALAVKLVKEARKSWRLSKAGKEKILMIGIAGALLASTVNFLFHSYIGSFEVKFLFWFLITFLLAPEARFVDIKTEAHGSHLPGRKNKTSTRILVLGLILVALYAAVHLGNSVGSLSLPRRTEDFGWAQDFGFYGWEKDGRGFAFRWAKKKAGLAVEGLGSTAVLTLMASHPDIEKNPVGLKIYLADDWFRKKELIKSVELKDKGWQQVEIPLASKERLGKNKEERDEKLSLSVQAGKKQARKINLYLEANRDLKPGQVLGIPDPRNIAFALGQVFYRYPPPWPEDKIIVLKTMPASNWAGPQGATLAAPGAAEISFSVEEENCYLRLEVRGQKALGLGPMCEVMLDGELVAKTLLEEDWVYLYLPPPLQVGLHQVKVEFTNDFYAPSLGQDRNLFLGSIALIRWP